MVLRDISQNAIRRFRSILADIFLFGIRCFSGIVGAKGFLLINLMRFPSSQEVVSDYFPVVVFCVSA